MSRRGPGRARQRGAALLIIAALLILGVAWGAVAALGRTTVSAQEREVLTGRALVAAKQALLAYAAQYAARTDHDKPGRLPCPEALASIGSASEGDEAASCSNTAATLGRLPWKTLGVDRLVDGSGEPLWYALSPGFRGVSPATVINFGTPGQLTYNDAPDAAVAVIVAPGRPLNTLVDATMLPSWCPAKVNQYVATRNGAPLDPANFLECGNATGSYRHAGSSQWTNDRAIVITAAEWAEAIAGGVNDRMQRQVAPAIRTWDAVEFATTGRSWGATYGLPYLPFASDWGDPTTTNYCGNQGTVRGLMPLDPGCYNNPWSIGSVSLGGLLSIYGGGSGCSDQGAYLRCSFQRTLGVGSATAQIVLSASNVARAFRGTLVPADLTISNTGSATISMSLPNSSSDATMTVNLTWSANLLIIGIGQVLTVDIPHLQNAQIHSDARLNWFWSNRWNRYTWYAVSPDETVNNANWWDACGAPGDPGCLTVSGLPASTGSANDKRLVLVLSARPLSTQTQPSSNLANYFEYQNASIGVIYETKSATTDFNDRLAACPFKYQDHLGADVVICN